MTDDPEHARLSGVYAGYQADPRKQRAWSAENPGNRAMRDEVVDALRPWLPRDGDVLDAGCGSGWLLARLAAGGLSPARLHGLDALDTRVDAARTAVPGADVRAGDVRRLPYPDGAFAFVVFLTVLSSLDASTDVRAALAEARRVLAPGGAVAVWEPRIATPNRATRLVRLRDLEAALGPATTVRPLTVAPPLARRLGRAAPRAYPVLARLELLSTHRLAIFHSHQLDG